jgi:hypothetical protein
MLTTFRNITPCSLVEVDQRFRGVYCHHQGDELRAKNKLEMQKSDGPGGVLANQKAEGGDLDKRISSSLAGINHSRVRNE